LLLLLEKDINKILKRKKKIPVGLTVVVVDGGGGG
jgi:hypothetical protein